MTRPLNELLGWAELVGTARFIAERTTDNQCFISEDTLEIMKRLAELTPVQQLFLAKGFIDGSKAQRDIDEAKNLMQKTSEK